MPTIEELYEAAKDAPGLDNPQPKIIAGNGVKDKTPYSLGNGYAGKKDIDEEGLKAVETRTGDRYQVGAFGGGYPNAKGFTDKKKYSDSVVRK